MSEDIKPLLSTAVVMGLISDDAEFRPNDAVAYSEALKIVLTAAGLDVKAKYKGGYPSGYSAVAKEYDIDDDLGDVSNGLMPKDAYQIILNTLLTRCDISTELQNHNEIEINWAEKGAVSYTVGL